MSTQSDLAAVAATIGTTQDARAALSVAGQKLQDAAGLIDSFTVLDNLAGTTEEAVSLLQQEADYCTRVEQELGTDDRALTDTEKAKVTLALKQAGFGIDQISQAAADSGYLSLASDLVSGVRGVAVTAAAAVGQTVAAAWPVFLLLGLAAFVLWEAKS